MAVDGGVEQRDEEPRRSGAHAYDARADVIRQTLDRMTDLGLSTLTARQALYDLELELWQLRGGTPQRDD